jgi:hypothetical protein
LSVEAVQVKPIWELLAAVATKVVGTAGTVVSVVVCVVATAIAE